MARQNIVLRSSAITETKDHVFRKVTQLTNPPTRLNNYQKTVFRLPSHVYSALRR